VTSRGGRARQPREADWLSVDAARDLILSRIAEGGHESVPISKARDRILATDVVSTIRHPAWDNSAMDGFAVRSEDIRGAAESSPVVLRVIEEVPAGGFPVRSLGPGEATRVMTGAPVPTEADGVTRLEYTQPGPTAGCVQVLSDADAGRNIRRKGEDLEVGEIQEVLDVLHRQPNTVAPFQIW